MLRAAALPVFMMLAQSTAGSCPVALAPCSPDWKNRDTQTFAYQGVADHAVQIKSYWSGGGSMCIGVPALTQEFAVQGGDSLCKEKGSVWAYTGNITGNWVSFVNQQSGNCMEAQWNNGKPGVFHNTCCGQGPVPGAEPRVCSAEEQQRQLWLQPATTANPYSVIKLQYKGPQGELCLTRPNATCA
eukprot:TRINITY_DN371_c0_g2_i2.p2 TRINITY_DN371_c0_g2~~TRINITY_DN371_c0_g2_i2.p2  ORF type:complete len:213 (+),score=85.24 TRINITY_DN371_c0_g2_i2:83-640(+)